MTTKKRKRPWTMGDAAVSEIRELLVGHGVPVAAFIDDHVANALLQRNRLAKRLCEIEGRDAVRAALGDACAERTMDAMLGEVVTRENVDG